MANSQLLHVCAQFCKSWRGEPSFSFFAADNDPSGLLLVSLSVCLSVSLSTYRSISFQPDLKRLSPVVHVHDCTSKFPIPSQVVWPSVHLLHPSAPIQPSIQLSCVCIDLPSTFSSCFCTPYFCHYPHCCCCCRCCRFLLPRVKRTNRPAAARRQTDLLLRCIWAGGCGHRYRIRSRSCSLLRNPPLHTPEREREREHVPSIPQTLVQLPDRAGSTLGTEVSLRYTHPDCLTAGPRPQLSRRQLFVSRADRPRRRS